MRALKIPLIVTFIGLALALLWALMPTASAVKANSDSALWETTRDVATVATLDWKAPPKGDHHIARVNKQLLLRLLGKAPMERSADLEKSTTIITLPMPDGSFQRFQIEESPVMDAEMVALYPEIKSYRGRGLDDATATVRMNWSPLGFHAFVLSAGQAAVNILPLQRNDVSRYVSYYNYSVPFECTVDEMPAVDVAEFRAKTPEVAIGSMLRIERVAIAATWEFCNEIGGDTLAGSVAAMNAYLNSVNAIFEKELSTRMVLVNAPQVIYASNNNVCGPGNNQACNAGNDPYTNNDQNAMLSQVRADLGTKVGGANFDVGHVLGTGGAGVAGLGVVCSDSGGLNNPLKAVGASRIFGPPGNSSASDLLAHEFGHQHGGSHSFNGTASFCGPARSGNFAWETGSGSTLMAYGGICDTDNIGANENRLHNGSYNQMLAYLATTSCATMMATGNTPPTVNAGPAYTIPKQTPFTLTATGSDADPGDVPNLRYAWEQLDAGGTMYANPPYGDQAGDPPTTTRPLFRAFAPQASPVRTFPSLTYILNNANVPPAVVNGFQSAESLPSVARTMNFRCTVRDQRGGVNDSEVAITVAGTAGPFAVTFPNGGQTLGGMQNVTWNVASTNVAPVNAANVRISLSTDGGNTFPTVLAASVPNTGSAPVTLPNGILSSNARIKVEAIGNIFFDITDANFTITPGDGCLAASNFSPQAGPVGTVVTITGINFTGVTSVTFNGTPATSFTVNSNTMITATVPAGATGGPIVLGKSGCTNLTVGRFSLCPNAPVALSVDDGSVESASSASSTTYFVNRLTPAGYPATVTQVSVYFHSFQQFPAGKPIRIQVGANPGGTTNIDGATFTSVDAVVGAVPGFTVVNLPVPVTVNSGDLLVGVQFPMPEGFPAALDLTNPQSRSYISHNGTTFTLQTDRNLMVRASQVYIGCSSGTVTPLITSITRTATGTIILQCVGTPNQVNNLRASPTMSPPNFTAVTPAPPVADAAGNFTWEDTAAPGFTERYYRLSIP